jgi:hypothetical protein
VIHGGGSAVSEAYMAETCGFSFFLFFLGLRPRL